MGKEFFHVFNNAQLYRKTIKSVFCKIIQFILYISNIYSLLCLDIIQKIKIFIYHVTLILSIYSKTFNSFNFTKCEHGKNVADGVLLNNFKDLKARDANVYVMTYDKELKEKFKDACHESNNLYALEWKILY